MARASQPELSKALGQPVAIVDRGGAAGTVGTTELARARPDGCTIAMVPNKPVTAQPHLIKLQCSAGTLCYTCLVCDNPQVLVLGRNAPFCDNAVMVAHARSAEEAIVYGSPGQGSTQHLLMVQLLNA
jgi:tripartite-type tricarboxylate transporter receptor subunit TctC